MILCAGWSESAHLRMLEDTFSQGSYCIKKMPCIIYREENIGFQTTVLYLFVCLLLLLLFVHFVFSCCCFFWFFLFVCLFVCLLVCCFCCCCCFCLFLLLFLFVCFLLLLLFCFVLFCFVLSFRQHINICCGYFLEAPLSWRNKKIAIILGFLNALYLELRSILFTQVCCRIPFYWYMSQDVARLLVNTAKIQVSLFVHTF